MVENFEIIVLKQWMWLVELGVKTKDKETKKGKGNLNLRPVPRSKFRKALLSIFEASQANFRVFLNQWTNSTKACETRDLDQSSGSTEGTPFLMSSDLAQVSLTVHPCCDCDAVLAGSPLESGTPLLQRPCSSNPPEFVVVEAEALFGPDPDVGGFQASSAREDFTSNATLKVQWQNDLEFYQISERVPRLEYFRSVQRLKALGSAVTSVFVSTFAMLSVMWTVFSLVAGTLAQVHYGEAPNDSKDKKHTLVQFGRQHKWLESGMEGLDGIEVILFGDQKDPESVEGLRHRIDRNDMQTRSALAYISAALKKHGLIDHEDWARTTSPKWNDWIEQ
ncbi:hypothetical protein C8R45DRAFT_931226 [Mycena sanguinolenta]|nr:hypothetical protein C8R45DRAFT_931226 [Mycena sanguinolenta]